MPINRIPQFCANITRLLFTQQCLEDKATLTQADFQFKGCPASFHSIFFLGVPLYDVTGGGSDQLLLNYQMLLSWTFEHTMFLKLPSKGWQTLMEWRAAKNTFGFNHLLWKYEKIFQSTAIISNIGADLQSHLSTVCSGCFCPWIWS